MKEKKEVKKEDKVKTNVMGMFIYGKGATIKAEVVRFLKNHLSVKTISNVITYDQGKEVINKFTFEDVQFVETFISFTDKTNGLTLALFINGQQVNMAMLK